MRVSYFCDSLPNLSGVAACPSGHCCSRTSFWRECDKLREKERKREVTELFAEARARRLSTSSQHSTFPYSINILNIFTKH